MPKPEEILLSVPQVAEQLAIKESTVRAWLLRRQLAYVRVGKRIVRVPLREVLRVIAEGTVPSGVRRDGGRV
jgi:excisionase family DNA binding protein